MKSKNAPAIVLAVIACTFPSTSAAEALDATTDLWKKAGADEGLRQAFERTMYSLKEFGHGTYRGENTAQRLTLEFDAQEARLSHPDGSVHFHLTGYGYGKRLLKPASAILNGNGNCLEYQRGDLTEWYVNGSQGLEQGFTLALRPVAENTTARESEPLVIALDVTGGLVPEQGSDDSSMLFESSRGVVLRYAGLAAVDARGLSLPSRLEVRGHEIRLIIDDRWAQYPVVVDPTWTQQQELTASDGGGNFGAVIAVSGNTALIGATTHTGGGAVYVFVNSGGVWTQQQELTASDGAGSDEFGDSISISGNTAVIGALLKNSYQGAAYVFVQSNGVWSQQQELTASDGAANDFFGQWVSVSGNTAMIGAYGHNSQQGAAYVFVQSGGVWTQQQELTASDGAAAGSGFGYAFSISGHTAMIGNPNRNRGAGAVYVFVQSSGVWSQQQELIASDGAANNFFGYPYGLSLSGNTAIIGAWGKNRSTAYSGVAYVFVNRGGVWTQQQELTPSGGAKYRQFGFGASVRANTALIGASGNYPGGAAYVFVLSSLGTNSLLVGSAGGTSSVVLSFSGAWTATSNSSFLHISAGSTSGTGSAEVVFTCDPFTGTGTRTGTLTIAGLTLTVTQAGTNYIGPGPATTLVSSGLNSPDGVVVDSSGNVYIADPSADAVYEWSAATQMVTTLVSGAPLSSPSGVAVDIGGNVYIADTGNDVVYEWSPTTQQMTALVSGFPLSSPNGVAVDSFSNVYIADAIGIYEWNAETQQVTSLVSSGLSGPLGVAVDISGNVYFSDTGNNAIKEWNSATQLVTTLVSSGLSNPTGVAVDGSGNVYIADTGNNAIKVWNAATQLVTTLVSSALNNPHGVAVDGSANVYIADTNNNAIEEIPNAFVGPTSLTEASPAGSDSLQVLPATQSLIGVFAPTSDQGWLNIGTIASGVINFSFTANPSTAARIAHISVLGQQSTVTQNGLTPQTITFGALANQSYGTAPFTVSATANSGLTVSFNSQTVSICTVSGTTVTLVAGGTCTIQATQGGNTTYAAATPVNQSFQVTQESQTITFAALASQALSTPPFALSAIASSGLTVNFKSLTTSVCTVSASTVTLVALGTCTIHATQAGNADYFAATPVNRSFSVKPYGQTITFGALANQPLSNPPFMVSATASSGLTVKFYSQTPHKCTVSGAIVTLVAVGTCTIEATQPGNSSYAAATPVLQSFEVTKGSQTITFDALSNQTLGTPPFSVTATASSGLTVGFNSRTTAVCTVSGTTVTLVTTGTCTIQATQAGNTNYKAAAPVDQSFLVTP